MLSCGLFDEVAFVFYSVSQNDQKCLTRELQKLPDFSTQARLCVYSCPSGDYLSGSGSQSAERPRSRRHSLLASDWS